MKHVQEIMFTHLELKLLMLNYKKSIKRRIKHMIQYDYTQVIKYIIKGRIISTNKKKKI